MNATATPSMHHELDAQDAARRFHQAGGHHQPAAPTNQPTRTHAMQQLFRAIAYRLQRANTPPSAMWHDITVFLEAESTQQARSKLQAVLAALWECRPSDIEAYNVASEDELIHGGSFGDFSVMGDVALLVTGWSHGPLFCRADRTLMLVSPPTLARLHAARMDARPFFLQQRGNAQAADEAARARTAQRQGLMHERMEGVHASGFGSL